jgi:hypothetical protein
MKDIPGAATKLLRTFRPSIEANFKEEFRDPPGLGICLSIRAVRSGMKYFWELETCCKFGSRALRRPVEVLTRENLEWILDPDPFVFSPV